MEFALTKGIPEQEERPIVDKGWERKQKGLLQVLWERGWIDEANFETYTLEVPKIYLREFLM